MSELTGDIRLVKYALLQTTIIPSLICDLLVFLHFIRHWRKQIVQAPQNHIILCLLIYSFIQKVTDVPFVMYYYRWGVVFNQTNIFCALWAWVDYFFTAANLQIVAWCSIERHLFIFHSQWMKKKWCLILFHYIPLIVCLLYTPIFYFYFILFPPLCVNEWDYSIIYGGGACYPYSSQFIGTFDWMFNNALPTLIIMCTNLLLCCRVVWQKIKNQQPVHWKRQRRMIFQLNFISLLCFLFMLPQTVVGVIQSLWDSEFLAEIQADYFYYIPYFINQFLPFIIISSLPEMRKDLKRWIEYMKMYFGTRGRMNRIFAINADDTRLATMGHT